MASLEDEVLATIRRHSLFAPGERVALEVLRWTVFASVLNSLDHRTAPGLDLVLPRAVDEGIRATATTRWRRRRAAHARYVRSASGW
jgi:hypothetical protein